MLITATLISGEIMNNFAGRQLADANASVFPVDTEDNFYLEYPETAKGIPSLREMASKTGGQ